MDVEPDHDSNDDFPVEWQRPSALRAAAAAAAAAAAVAGGGGGGGGGALDALEVAGVTPDASVDGDAELSDDAECVDPAGVVRMDEDASEMAALEAAAASGDVSAEAAMLAADRDKARTALAPGPSDVVGGYALRARGTLRAPVDPYLFARVGARERPVHEQAVRLMEADERRTLMARMRLFVRRGEIVFPPGQLEALAAAPLDVIQSAEVRVRAHVDAAREAARETARAAVRAALASGGRDGEEDAATDAEVEGVIGAASNDSGVSPPSTPRPGVLNPEAIPGTTTPSDESEEEEEEEEETEWDENDDTDDASAACSSSSSSSSSSSRSSETSEATTDVEDGDAEEGEGVRGE